jgi:outer membrane autotransporter protein
MEQEADRVKITTTAHSFEWAAENRLERTIGRHLNALIPNASDNLLDVMGAFQNAEAFQLEAAFSSLSPAVHDAATRAAILVARQAPGNVQRRMAALPSQRNPASQPPGAMGPDSPVMGSQRLTGERANGIWLGGVGLKGEQDGEDGFAGYDFQTVGLEIGYDRVFQKKVMIGTSIDYASTDVDIDDNGGDSDIDSIGGSLYAARYSDGWYFDGILRYANQDFDSHRKMSVGSTYLKARSSHSGDLISGSSSVRYDISRSAWTFGPLASIQYMWLDENGFTEKGAGGANLIVSGRTTESLISELGVRVSRTIETDRGSYIPAARIGWLHDFDIGDRSITSAYTGAPATPFSVDGQKVDRNGALIGIDLGWQGSDAIYLGLQYDGEIRDSYSSYRIMGNLYYAF